MSSFRSIDEIDSSIGTSIGLRRTQNEDRSCLARLSFGKPGLSPIHLAVVCDGLGGMEAGEEAAAQALTMVVASTFSNISGGAAPKDALVCSVEKANEEIFSHFHGNGGTTLSAAMILSEGQCFGVNVGDSRIYSLKLGSSFIQLTTDDNVATEVQHLVAINPDQLEFGEHLTQFVGIGPEIRIRAQQLLLGADIDSRLVLASDGAWRATNGAFGKVILNAPTANDVVKRAINLSNWCGGVDNTTVLVTGSVHEMSCNHTKALLDLRGLSKLDFWTPSGHNVFYFDGETNPNPLTVHHGKSQKEPGETKPRTKPPRAKGKKSTAAELRSHEYKEKPKDNPEKEKPQQFDIEILVDNPTNKNANNTN